MLPGTKTITETNSRLTMKITFFIPDFKGGGAQNMIINMANEFARRDHLVTILTINKSGPFADRIDPAVTVTSLEKERTAQAFFELRKYLKGHQPDIVLSALFHVNILLLLAKITTPGIKSKIIVTERNHFSARVKNSDKSMDKLFPLLVLLFYRFADKVIGISKGVADDIRKIAKLPEHKVTWIHNPVVAESEIKALESHADLPWTDGSVIVTSGRLVPQKDYPTMLQAFAKLAEIQKAYLLIIGDGPQRLALEKAARELGIGDKIHFAGFVDNPIAHMKRADLFVITSRWEGFCNVIVEALLCGLPVVATDCPSGPAEILEDGKYGTLVPVGDVNALAAAMAQTLDTSHDPERQKQRAMDFTVEKICNRYEEVMKAL